MTAALRRSSSLAFGAGATGFADFGAVVLDGELGDDDGGDWEGCDCTGAGDVRDE